MDQPYIGAIVLFAGNFAPRGWSLCQGQLMSISQNAALFSILGTTYGGNGTSTFALPDLRARVPVGQGQGPGLSDWILGEAQGTENVSLLISNMPAHNHLVSVCAADASTPTASGAYLANDTGNYQGDAVTVNAYGTTPGATLNPAAISVVGSSIPHNNIQPSLCLNYIIALVGLFPTRN